MISGERVLPQELRTAIIHRLELPQGRFERHIPLPPGRYGTPQSGVANGCLVVDCRRRCAEGIRRRGPAMSPPDANPGAGRARARRRRRCRPTR